MPTERKHASAATAEVVLVENPLSPRFEIDLCRPDGVFLLAGTDDERTTSMGTPFDPQNLTQLRVVAGDLCQDLRLEITGLQNGEVHFNELQEVFRSTYQPKAIALVRALLYHVPTGDPRITVSTQEAGDRQVTRSDDLEIVSQPLDPRYTCTQLKSVVKIISQLLDFLPT